MLLREALYSRTSIPLVSRTLDACALRSKAIANNLANVATPGYQRIEVDFESRLRQALDEQKLSGTTTQPMHMPLGRPDLERIQPMAYRSQDPILPGEVNNVDVDIESAKLAENQLLFQYGVKFIQERKGALEAAISLQPKP